MKKNIVVVLLWVVGYVLAAENLNTNSLQSIFDPVGIVQNLNGQRSPSLLSPFVPAPAGDTDQASHFPQMTFVTTKAWSLETTNGTPKQYPTWVQYSGQDRSPLWGFVRVTSTNDVGVITRAGYNLVTFGNYADQSYPDPGILPFYDGPGQFWCPGKGYDTNIPPVFIVPVWIDRRDL